jgi:hypothetical protein
MKQSSQPFRAASIAVKDVKNVGTLSPHQILDDPTIPKRWLHGGPQEQDSV